MKWRRSGRCHTRVLNLPLLASPRTLGNRFGRSFRVPVVIQKGSSVAPKGLEKIFIEQLRAARGLLGWSQTKLASMARLALATVKRVESPFGLRVSDEARAKLRQAAEAAGVEFIEENGGAG